MTANSTRKRVGPASPLPTPARPSSTLVGALLLCLFLPSLNLTIVSTAIPQILADLGGFNHISWVVVAYLLAATVAAPILGKLSDQFGRRNLVVLCLVVFMAGSLVAGIAQSIEQLLASRVIQGIGGGALIPMVYTTIGGVVAPRERSRYLGHFAAVFAAASILGPIVGGLLTDHLSWRWAFLANVPMGVVALAMTARHLHGSRNAARRQVDYLGAGLLMAAIGTAVLLLNPPNADPWAPHEAVVLAASCSVALAALWRAEASAAEPILPITLFRERTYSAGAIVAFAFTGLFFAILVFVPVYFQVVAGQSAMSSGLLLLPLLIGFSISSALAGRVVLATGRYRFLPIVGTCAAVVPLALLATVHLATSPGLVAIYAGGFGVAAGPVHQVVMLAIQNSTPARDLGAATAAVQLFRMLGAMATVGLFGAIVTAHVSSVAAGLPDASVAAINAALHGAIENGSTQEALRLAVAEGTSTAFGLCIPIAVLAVGGALAIQEVPLQ